MMQTGTVCRRSVLLYHYQASCIWCRHQLAKVPVLLYHNYSVPHSQLPRGSEHWTVQATPWHSFS